MICGSTSSRLDCVLMQTTSGFVASTFSKSVVILTSHGPAEQLADGLALFGGVGDDAAGELDVLRAGRG